MQQAGSGQEQLFEGLFRSGRDINFVEEASRHLLLAELWFPRFMA